MSEENITNNAELPNENNISDTNFEAEDVESHQVPISSEVVPATNVDGSGQDELENRPPSEFGENVVIAEESAPALPTETPDIQPDVEQSEDKLNLHVSSATLHTTETAQATATVAVSLAAAVVTTSAEESDDVVADLPNEPEINTEADAEYIADGDESPKASKASIYEEARAAVRPDVQLDVEQSDDQLNVDVSATTLHTTETAKATATVAVSLAAAVVMTGAEENDDVVAVQPSEPEVDAEDTAAGAESPEASAKTAGIQPDVEQSDDKPNVDVSAATLHTTETAKATATVAVSLAAAIVTTDAEKNDDVVVLQSNEGFSTEADTEDTADRAESPKVSEGRINEADTSVIQTQEQREQQETSKGTVPTATVKMQLVESKEIITVAFPINQTFQHLRQQLASQLNVKASLLLFSVNDKYLSDTETLKELNVQPNGTIQLDVTSNDPAQSPLRTSVTKQQFGASDVITVRLMKENDDFEDVVVEIERSLRKKPFLGGYRHKLTGIEFHHASAQTDAKPVVPSNVPKKCRDTQTVFEGNRTSQTTNTTSTQMTRIGCYISTVHDKKMRLGEYTTADEYLERRIKAVIVIQAYFRRWQARHLVEELKHDRDKRLKWEEQEEIRKRKEKERRLRREFERRMNPKTKEDFDLLYAALEKWRMEELALINEELDGAERKAALCALLEQETQLIASIGRHKIEASKENKEKAIEGFLSKAAAPKRWKTFDGRYTEMDTEYTIRARELMTIYNSINMRFINQDERLDLLLTLKHTVKEHDCKLTRDIIELIDREADLLMRGICEINLEGLRKRISTLFLQFCKIPAFNPQAARLLKVPQDPSTLRKDIYFCRSANQYLSSQEFKIVSNSRAVGKCKKVHDMDNAARTRQDFSHYRIMLRNLRREEESYADESKIAYLIQEKDLRYLVENVWGAHSILSAWDDVFDLLLVRWDKYEEWSPWNCILLTKDEAMSHSRLEYLDEAYGQVFIHKVKNKHTLARMYFSRIPGMAEQLRRKSTGSQRLQGPGIVRGKRALSTL